MIRRPDFEKIEYQVEYLEALLERSKNSSLDIALFDDDDFSCTFPTEIVQTIYPHLPRCRKLDLTLGKFSTEAITFPLPGPLER